jgi:hypothetical protein
VNASTGSRRGPLRVGLALLLLVSAFFVALPWLGCLMSSRPGLYAFSNLSITWGMCTTDVVPFRFPDEAVSIPGFTGPYFGNLILGVVYLIAGVYVAVTKRSL